MGETQCPRFIWQEWFEVGGKEVNHRDMLSISHNLLLLPSNKSPSLPDITICSTSLYLPSVGFIYMSDYVISVTSTGY